MGIAIGIALVGATIGSFVLINLRVGRMARHYNDQWTVDPHTGQPVPPEQQGPGQHGDHQAVTTVAAVITGGFSGGGGHHGGFSDDGGGGGGHHG